MMKCKNIREKLTEYLDGGLSPELRKDIETHIGDCVSCRRELESLKKILSSVKEVSVPDPGELFWVNFLPEVRRKISEENKRIPWYGIIFKPKVVWGSGTLVIVTVFLFIFFYFGARNANKLENGGEYYYTGEYTPPLEEQLVQAVEQSEDKKETEKRIIKKFFPVEEDSLDEKFLERYEKRNLDEIIDDLDEEQIKSLIEKLNQMKGVKV